MMSIIDDAVETFEVATEFKIESFKLNVELATNKEKMARDALKVAPVKEAIKHYVDFGTDEEWEKFFSELEVKL